MLFLLRLSQGVLKSRRVCESSILFFFLFRFVLFFLFCIFQASRSKCWVSAKDEKEVIPALSPVLKSIFQGGHVHFKKEIEQC